MANPAKVRTASGTWVDLAVQSPDISNYSTTTQMNTAIDNAKGLTLILSTTLSGAGTYNITNCFSSTYDNYKIIFTGVSGEVAAVRLNLLSGTTPDTSSAYTSAMAGTNQVGTNKPLNQSNATYWHLCNFALPDTTGVDLNIYKPFLAKYTLFTIVSADEDDWFQGRAGGGRHNLATSYNGIRFVSSGGNFSANVKIYGYRNS